ncbi:MAG: sigma-70 family RNA polymerase sigma factor [Candidatus Omnitrophica bacterium]|nr:sigma-70 family RNA polymerase sigma factor [Candidatus Omnitrophota bacterium]
MLYNKEEELLAKLDELASGSDEAFEDILRLVYSDILNIALKYLLNYEDAKDVSQEVSLKLYHKIKTYHRASKLSTWIYRVVVNACIDFLRRKKSVVSFNDAIKTDTKAMDEVEKRDNQNLISKAIAKLPNRQKNVIILKHFEGLKIAQISKVLRCSQSSVKTHLYRAIDSLRNELGGII